MPPSRSLLLLLASMQYTHKQTKQAVALLGYRWRERDMGACHFSFYIYSILLLLVDASVDQWDLRVFFILIFVHVQLLLKLVLMVAFLEVTLKRAPWDKFGCYCYRLWVETRGGRVFSRSKKHWPPPLWFSSVQDMIPLALRLLIPSFCQFMKS